MKSSDEDDDDEVSLSKDDNDNTDNEDDGQDDDNEQTELDNDGEDFVHPKFSTHDEEERQEEEDKKEEGSYMRVQTPSHFESTNDETYDEVTQGDNVEGEELDEEDTNEEEEVNELYKDVNVNLERRDAEMTYAPQTNVQGTQVTEDTHVIITAATPEVQHQSSSVSSRFISNMLNLTPDTGIDSILNLNTEYTSLVDVSVTTHVEMPLSSVTTLPPPPIPNIQPQQQTPVSTPTIVPNDFLEFKQTNHFAEAVSSIPDIVDQYLANKMNEAIKAAVQLQSDRLRSKAQADNEDFINKIDENMKKIIKEQVKTSNAVAANLSELELKKILIDKMENNKSYDRSVKHKNLFKALVEAYESDKDILALYGDIVTLKRRRDDKDEDEEPSVGSNRGSKRRRAGKEPESTSAPKEKTSKSTGKSKEGSKSHQKSTGKSAQAEEPIHADEDLEEPAHQEFDTGFTEDQPVDETTQHPDCTLAQNEDPRESFNELMDTPLDFSAFVLNRLKVDTLTPELLAGPTFELMKGSCKSLVELEYFLEEVCKATTDQLDWNNPEGQQYPHDLRKPLPLIPNSRGRRTKLKLWAPHIKWIEDFIPNSMWSQVPIVYDKHALWGISHWGRKRQQFYGFVVNRESAHDVYSKHRILAVTKLKIVEWHNYKHLDWITVRKLTNLNIEERLALGVSLRMFTRSIVLRRHVEDLQLGVESYQKKLNLSRPDTYRSDLKRKSSYTTYSNPKGFIYQNKDKKNILMRIDELHKFSDRTINDVRSTLDDIPKQIWMEYLPWTI
ncbi:hypothetical protein Tco_0724874 [Tanacetum coccineum]|uniref:Uncharacterized protein n=1 Tax=Tanacetum coccineum TaxID=301880 RepID=A0ABQ4YCS4_9ASTR